MDGKGLLVDEADLDRLLIALATFVSREPLAIGTTVCFGKRQPSCSAISKPMLFDPSA